MKCLYVLFDAECAMCVRCREWLSRQPAFVPLHFIPLQSPDLPRFFPGINVLKPNEQLLVVGDNGAGLPRRMRLDHVPLGIARIP